MSMGRVHHAWVGLGWVGSRIFKYRMGWVGSSIVKLNWTSSGETLLLCRTYCKWHQNSNWVTFWNYQMHGYRTAFGLGRVASGRIHHKIRGSGLGSVCWILAWIGLGQEIWTHAHGMDCTKVWCSLVFTLLLMSVAFHTLWRFLTISAANPTLLSMSVRYTSQALYVWKNLIPTHFATLFWSTTFALALLSRCHFTTSPSLAPHSSIPCSRLAGSLKCTCLLTYPFHPDYWDFPDFFLLTGFTARCT